MKTEKLSIKNEKEWNEFVLNSDYAWFRHTTDWLKYSSCCRFDSNTKNFSFLIRQNNKIQAIIPLLVEYSYPEKTYDCFAMYGDYTPLPAFGNEMDVDKSKIYDCIQAEVEKVAKENNINYGKFIIDPLIKYNYFKDFECFNLMNNRGKVKFSTTNMVDLRLDIESILRKMRKGHKSAIKQILKENNYRVDIFDSSNITADKMLKFKEIHKIDAGCQTRTNESWNCMLEWVQQGKAILVMLRVNNFHACNVNMGGGTRLCLWSICYFL